MTKDALDTMLSAFLSEGFCEEYYTQNEFSIFRFLKTVYVGFVHDGTETGEMLQVQGALLTKVEAELAIRFDPREVFAELCLHRESCLTFSEDLLKKCRSPMGRMRLKSKLKKAYMEPKQEPDMEWIPNRISTAAGCNVLMSVRGFRSNGLKKCNRLRKITYVISIICLTCTLLFLSLMLTHDWRKQWNNDRASVTFDKNSREQEYVHVEVDLLTPFATIYDLDFEHQKSYHGTYYLWGNSKTGQYGLLMFEVLVDESAFVKEEQAYTVLDTPVRFYGKTGAISYLLARPLNKDETQENTYPIFSEQISDNSDGMDEFFEALGIDTDDQTDLGASYLIADTYPEKTVSPINEVLNNLMIVFICLATLQFLPLLFFAARHDITRSAITDPNLPRNICASMLVALWPEEARKNGQLEKILADNALTNQLLLTVLQDDAKNS